MFRLFILTAVFSLGSLMLSNAFGGTSDQTRGEECMAITGTSCSGDDAPSGKPGCPINSRGGCDSVNSACNRCSGGAVLSPHICVTRYFNDTNSHVCTLDGVNTTNCGDLMSSFCFADSSAACKCSVSLAVPVLVNGKKTACLYQNCKQL